MGKQATAPAREEILRRMYRLATGRANDAVKLAFLPPEDLGKIGKLDLEMLQEFKRGANGTVEVRLADRVGILEKLLQAAGSQDDVTGIGFLQALEGLGREDG